MKCEKVCVIAYKHNSLLFCKYHSGLHKLNTHICCSMHNIATFCWKTYKQHVDKPLLVGDGHEHFCDVCTRDVWSEVCLKAHAIFVLLHANKILCALAHEVSIKYNRCMIILCFGCVAQSPFQVLHNCQKILYSIAPLSSAYLFQCVAFSSIESSYFCNYRVCEDMLLKHDSGESNKAVG